MIHSWQIGDVKVTSLVEYFAPTHDPAFLYPDYDPAVLEANRPWLEGVHWFPLMNRLVIAIRIWIVHAGGNVIVVDTGVGNGKPRAAARMNHLNSLVPAWLSAAGAAPEQVTHVVMTHLHADHVGWNTVRDGDRWVPTFPKARYYVPKDDFAYFRDFDAKNPAADGGSFTDSVMPIVDAGVVEFIDTRKTIADCLEVVPAPGHTPGQLNYWVRSRGDVGVFSADIFHHPLQIVEPGWNTAFCVLPDAARATRAAFLAKAADTAALVMPCHFAPPHCGFIRRAGDRFAFEPASL